MPAEGVIIAGEWDACEPVCSWEVVIGSKFGAEEKEELAYMPLEN